MSDFLGGVEEQAKWRNPNNTERKKWFQEEIIKMCITQERVLSKLRESERMNEIIFFDRGIHDALAYLNEEEIPSELLSEINNTVYDLVFVLDTPPQEYFRPGPGRTTDNRKKSVDAGDLHFAKYKKYFPGKVFRVSWSVDRVREIFKVIKGEPHAFLKPETTSYFKNMLVSFDQFGNALCGGNPDNTISARVGYFSSITTNYKRYYWKTMEKVINFTFWPVDGLGHCWQAYQADRNETYNDSGSDVFRIMLSVAIAVPCVVISLILYILYPFWKWFEKKKK